jgi:hypothetical protein
MVNQTFHPFLDDRRDIFPRFSCRVDNQEGSLFCRDGTGDALIGMGLHVVHELVLAVVQLQLGDELRGYCTVRRAGCLGFQPD